MLPKGTLGPGIIGEKAFEQEQAELVAGANIYGPGILGPGITGEKEEAAEEEAQDSDANDFPDMSTDKLKEWIGGNPEYADPALTAELKRDPGPRKGALSFLREVELDRDDGGRPEVLAQIEEAMNQGGGSS